MTSINENIQAESDHSDTPTGAAGDTDTDADSALGSDDPASDTTSIKSWTQAYRIENGRRYHSFGTQEYWGPNDDDAQEHNDLAHELYTRTFGGALHLAPLKEPLRVLDVGNGTGIWCIDFADLHPECEVIGVDISPIQPTWVPPNVRFEVADVEMEWTWPEGYFDYIHMRTLYGGIANWPALYKRCLRCLKPGGFLEQAEYSPRMHSEDGTLPQDSPMGRCNVLGQQCYDKLGRIEGELNMFETMKGRIETAGFVDVTEIRFKWPLGTWPKNRKLKELGMWARAHLDMGMEGYMMRLMTAMLGVPPAEVYVLCAQVRAQLRDRRVHGVWAMNVVVAKRADV